MSKFQNFFMKTAFLLAEHSHCVSHHVGAVIVKDNRIISMGYNGTPPGVINCDSVFDKNNFNREDHSLWSNQKEIHAEMNALSFAVKWGISVDECDVYVTMTPCNHCLKNMVMSGIKRIFYYYKYDRANLDSDMTQHIEIIQLANPELDKFIIENNLLYSSSPNLIVRKNWPV